MRASFDSMNMLGKFLVKVGRLRGSTACCRCEGASGLIVALDMSNEKSFRPSRRLPWLRWGEGGVCVPGHLCGIVGQEKGGGRVRHCEKILILGVVD